MSLDNLTGYQKKRIIAQKIIKLSKKNARRQLCSSIGREIELDDICSMIKKSGKRNSVKIPALTDGEYLAFTNEEKADLPGKTFVCV